MSHLSIQPTLYLYICWYVKWSMAERPRNWIYRQKCWRVYTYHIHIWEMKLVIHWSHSWLRNQKINFGIGKDVIALKFYLKKDFSFLLLYYVNGKCLLFSAFYKMKEKGILLWLYVHNATSCYKKIERKGS